ncbi:MAG: hypothetical protein EPO11_00060 [Gammaproteobacteria bacterium]|nr:MAG: hypothetical protein EPO11_00060 [Gammaproteobacteria bacterium]
MAYLISNPFFSIDLFVSKRFHKKEIIACYDLPSTQKKPYLCIFSHFDMHNRIDDYVIYYLTELARCGCEIIFVTTSAALSLEERQKIASLCSKIIIKGNRGRDFGAFKCGIDEITDFSHYEKIILANDSVYGPFFDLTNVIHYGDQHGLDMWGATDSLEHRYHVQSYLVVFAKTLIQSPSFKQFWQQVYELGSRENIIQRYEIGMSSFFLKQGFKLGAYCNYATLRHDLGLKSRPVNSTHYLWDVLITHYRHSFIKRELLALNPAKINISNWKQLLQQYTQFDIHMISNHLNRTTRSA